MLFVLLLLQSKDAGIKTVVNLYEQGGNQSNSASLGSVNVTPEKNTLCVFVPLTRGSRPGRRVVHCPSLLLFQPHQTPVVNRAAGAHRGGHGLHQQGHERGREEPDRHGPVLWAVSLANEEVGVASGTPTRCPLPFSRQD